MVRYGSLTRKVGLLSYEAGIIAGLLGTAFNGTTQYSTRAALFTGGSDSKILSGSFWFKLDGGDGAEQVFFGNFTASVSTRFSIVRTTANTIRLLGRNAAGATILNVNSTATFTADSVWKHCAFAVDMANQAGSHILVNGADAGFTVTTFTNDTLDLTTAENSIAADFAGSVATLMTGGLSEDWMAYEQYIDWTIPSNLEKVYDSGKPVYVGPDGSLVTGVVPIYYSATGNPELSTGTGGVFVNTGSPTSIPGPGA